MKIAELLHALLERRVESVDSGAGRAATPAEFITSKQRGVSLIELIIYIVIVSTAITGMLSVMNVVSQNNADPAIHKQTLAIAESLLEEIELQDFSLAPSGALTRATYQNVMDYNNYSTTAGIVAPDGSAIGGLTNYNVTSVTVVPNSAAWNGMPVNTVVTITVTVTPPSGDPITSTGYRANY